MEKIDKVLITLTSDADLEEMVKDTNAGFTGGRVTKTQLLSWIVPHFRKAYFPECIEEIRQAHFDRLAHMKTIVREMEQAKRDGKTDLNLHEMLAPVLAQNEGQPKRKKGALKDTTKEPTEI